MKTSSKAFVGHINTFVFPFSLLGTTHTFGAMLLNLYENGDVVLDL